MSDATKPKRLFDVRSAAEYLGIATGTIYNELSKGTFPIRPKRIGKLVRFDLRDMDKYIDDLGQ